MLNNIQAGLLPAELADLLSPFATHIHDAHIQSLAQSASYPICGLEIQVAPGLYHPHPASSSIFTLRTLLRENRHLGKLLELGCGTGALSLALLDQGLAEHAVMVDVSAVAIACASVNAKNAGLTAQTRLLQGNMFAPLPGERFDTILFNMPLMHQAHEGTTHLALDDTEGRLARHFFAHVLGFLQPGGQVYFAYSNLSDASLLADFSRRCSVALVAAEWVASSGFWLLVYRAQAIVGESTPD